MYKVGRSRTPQGVRGLKQTEAGRPVAYSTSHSARSAWIETTWNIYAFTMPKGRTPQGVRGLKPVAWLQWDNSQASHSARSAWIETFVVRVVPRWMIVALRKECVD